MSYEKLVRLMILLSKNTESGDIRWEESAQANAFETSFPNYTVKICREKEYQQDSYKLSIIDDQGDVVEEATDEDFRSVIEDAYSLMKSTFETARRQAKGVEQALDSILGNLHDPDELPF